MLLGTNHSKVLPSVSDNEQFIVQLLFSHQLAEAYQLLSNSSDISKSVSGLYNQALCCFWVEAYAEALTLLNKGSGLLRPPLQQPSMMDKIGQAISDKQKEEATYKSALTEDYIKHFPHLSKDKFTRLKVDCLLALEQWEKVLSVSTPLKSKNYKNINEAILLAQEKLR